MVALFRKKRAFFLIWKNPFGGWGSSPHSGKSGEDRIYPCRKRAF